MKPPQSDTRELCEGRKKSAHARKGGGSNNEPIPFLSNIQPLVSTLNSFFPPPILLPAPVPPAPPASQAVPTENEP